MTATDYGNSLVCIDILPLVTILLVVCVAVIMMF